MWFLKFLKGIADLFNQIGEHIQRRAAAGGSTADSVEEEVFFDLR